MKSLVVIGSIFCLNLGGCGVWPSMTDSNGYRPIEMGKRDQVLYWNAPQPIHLSSDFGKSFRQMRSTQILNISAEENLDMVEGLNGQAGVSAMGRYQNMFKKPPFGSKSGGGSGKK